MKFRQLMTRAALPLSVALVVAAVGARPVSAANYSDSVQLDPASMQCGFFTNVAVCRQIFMFAAPRAGNSGDNFAIHVTTASTLALPANSEFLVSLGDTRQTFGPGTTGPDKSFNQVTLTGYSGPPIEFPATSVLSRDNGFLAIAPVSLTSPAFSLTGADATLQLLSTDPFPLTEILIGTARFLSSAPATLSDLQGGTADSPFILPGGPIGQITGTISGNGPESDFYNFNWGGGVFQTQGSVFGADPTASFDFELFNADGSLNTDVTLNGGDGFSQLLAVGDLAAGHYTIGLATHSVLDPNFTLDFLTPVGTAVPEPASWALMLLGFCGLGAVLRGRRATLA